jgi:adenylate cyclase
MLKVWGRENMSTQDAMKVKRKLCTIMAADVAGYSRLIQRDEDGTLLLLSSHRRIFDELIEINSGRIANTAGDSVIAVFESPADAVNCAIQVQKALRGANARIVRDLRVRFRIGLHLGDVVLNGGDVLGDVVNIAARLENACEPGGICMSEAVYNHVQKKLNAYKVADLGGLRLKNIEVPVAAYEMMSSRSGYKMDEDQETFFHGYKGRRLIALIAAIAVIFGAIGVGIMVAHNVFMSGMKKMAIQKVPTQVSPSIKDNRPVPPMDKTPPLSVAPSTAR